MFGPIPPDSPPDDVSPPSSPSPSPPCSRASPASPSSFRSASPESDADAEGVLDPSSPPDITQLPLLLAVQRAINLKDGPLFMTVMDRVNALLYDLKYPRQPPDPFSSDIATNPLMATAGSWSNTEDGLPYKVLMRILEENYQRTVGPNVPKLRKYEAFSSTVYGELMPSLVYEILNLTDLKEDSLFLDLGSGVGNVVVQASLQTGCRSYGIELMPIPARVALDTSTQMKIRCRMWGVRVGEMELEKGDMLTSKRVDQLIAQADVVLVDNKVFEESCE
jgi:H3 lysine-79-specific histone-lysine N-methyltransferase